MKTVARIRHMLHLAHCFRTRTKWSIQSQNTEYSRMKCVWTEPALYIFIGHRFIFGRFFKMTAEMKIEPNIVSIVRLGNYAISKCEINLIRKHRIGILTSNWKGGKYKWKSESSRITKSVNDDAGCLSSKRNFYRILKFFFSILFSSNSWNVEATYLRIGTHIDNEISWVIKL